MAYTITPHSIANLGDDPMALLTSGGRHVVQPIGSYQARKPIVSMMSDPHDACGYAWNVYQNVDDDHLTPDGGRSLMTGDMALLVDDDGVETWWIAASSGWIQTFAPGDRRWTSPRHQ